MKRLLLLLTGLVWWGCAAAQDMILMRNADEVKAEVMEITDSDVLYKVWQGDGKMLSVPRSSIFSVTYANGERELFTDAPVAAAQNFASDYPWPKVTRTYRPGDLFDEDGVRGLVISVTDGGRHGLLLSLELASVSWSRKQRGLEFTAGINDRKDGWINQQAIVGLITAAGVGAGEFPAFEWCIARGGGWYLPAADELEGFCRLLGIDTSCKVSFSTWNQARKRSKEMMEAYGGNSSNLNFCMLWSSTEFSEAAAFICGALDFPGAKGTQGLAKITSAGVRAVHKF